MSQSLANVLINTIFSTKNREPWLRDPNLRKETFAFLGGTAKTLNCQPIKIGGHIDHVHLLTNHGFALEFRRKRIGYIKESGCAIIPGIHPKRPIIC